MYRVRIEQAVGKDEMRIARMIDDMTHLGPKALEMMKGPCDVDNLTEDGASRLYWALQEEGVPATVEMAHCHGGGPAGIRQASSEPVKAASVLQGEPVSVRIVQSKRVRLESACNHQVAVIKAVREVLPHLGLLEGKHLVDGAPCDIDCATEADAGRLVRLIAEAGGKASRES